MGVHSITEYCRTNNIGVAECVQQMRDRVREETKLTVSAGIAPNMVYSSWIILIHYGTDVSGVADACKGIAIQEYPSFHE